MNAFLDHAQAVTPRPVKSRLKIFKSYTDAPMMPTKEEKAQREKHTLLRGWRKWRREREEIVLAGPHGKDVRGLIAFCDTMTLSSADALVRLVRDAAWLRSADADTRFEVLSMISARISKLLTVNGLDPLDDPIDDAPPNAFLQIREILR